VLRLLQWLLLDDVALNGLLFLSYPEVSHWYGIMVLLCAVVCPLIFSSCVSQRTARFAAVPCGQPQLPLIVPGISHRAQLVVESERWSVYSCFASAAAAAAAATKVKLWQSGKLWSVDDDVPVMERNLSRKLSLYIDF